MIEFVAFFKAYVGRQVRHKLVWFRSNKRVFKMRRTVIVAV